MAKVIEISAEGLQALDGSIVKWQDIVAGDAIDKGDEDCPLCRHYRHNRTNMQANCDECPVSIDTGESLCQGSPYDQWLDATGYGADYEQANTNSKSMKAAVSELEYLKELRSRCVVVEGEVL